MNKTQIKEALQFASDKLLDAITETPWTLMLFGGWSVLLLFIGWLFG